jgi:long-chain acyl-CoA synthetase
VGDTGVEVKIAEDGEILGQGGQCVPGYFKNPELTAETVKDGWLYTGDVGTLKTASSRSWTARKIFHYCRRKEHHPGLY